MGDCKSPALQKKAFAINRPHSLASILAMALPYACCGPSYAMPLKMHEEF